MNPTTTRVGEATQALREDLRELRQASAEAAREKLDSGRKALQQRMTEHPLQSLAIAAAAGFAIGWLVHRRRN